jgi:hypothetical protein
MREHAARKGSFARSVKAKLLPIDIGHVGRFATLS